MAYMPGNISIDLSKDSEQLEIADNLVAQKRSNRNKCFKFFYELVISVTFNFLIYCFILANTITLALHRYDESEE